MLSKKKFDFKYKTHKLKNKSMEEDMSCKH